MYCEWSGTILSFLYSSLQESLFLEVIIIVITFYLFIFLKSENINAVE